MLLDNVKKFAAMRGTTIKAIERNAGLANGTIRKWNHANPRVDKVIAVAKTLDVPIETLLRD